MSTVDDDPRVQSGLDQRFRTVDSLIPPRPAWRAKDSKDAHLTVVRASTGPSIRGLPQGRRSFGTLGVLVAILLLAALGVVLGTGGVPSMPAPAPTASASTEPLTTPSASPDPAATAAAGVLRPAVEPRLAIPIRPRSAWTLVENQQDMLSLIYLLDEVGSLGYNVGVLVVEPHGVYDPINEELELPLPADLIAWIQAHPDLDAGQPFELTVAGLPATAIDVTVTYPKGGPKGQTAQFIDIGPGSWNLESPSKKRIVLVQLPDHPILIVFESRPEFFDSGIGPFQTELAQIAYTEPGPSP